MYLVASGCLVYCVFAVIDNWSYITEKLLTLRSSLKNVVSSPRQDAQDRLGHDFRAISRRDTAFGDHLQQ